MKKPFSRSRGPEDAPPRAPRLFRVASLREKPFVFAGALASALLFTTVASADIAPSDGTGACAGPGSTDGSSCTTDDGRDGTCERATAPGSLLACVATSSDASSTASPSSSNGGGGNSTTSTSGGTPTCSVGVIGGADIGSGAALLALLIPFAIRRKKTAA